MEIKAKENGPYLVKGAATYVDANGQEQTTQGSMVALCRCGNSANKPFCDGTHKKIEFAAETITLTVADE
jgi:CDGSH-type Zn-finger protein